MHENIDYTEEDNWFEDNVTWPKRYIKAMRHNGISLDSRLRSHHVEDSEYTVNLLKEANRIENEIKDELEIDYPDTWEDLDKKEVPQSDSILDKLDINPFLIKVKRGGKEYRYVLDEFKVGKCNQDNVVAIHRIQNYDLWNMYYCKKQEVYYKHYKNSNFDEPEFERSLWHGTSSTDPLLIVESEEGIDKRFQKVRETVNANVNNKDNNAPKFYGIGCYFSTKPGYSDNQYAYTYHIENENKENAYYQLIMCRVCVGKYDFGTVALEADQMRTLKKQDLDTVLQKLVEKQKHKQIADLYKDIDTINQKLLKKSLKTAKIEELKKNKVEKQKMLIDKLKKYEEKVYYPNRERLIQDEIKKTSKINPTLRFDSIMDDRFMVVGSKVHQPRMFVTFDNAQAYPEYIITYKRGKRKASKDKENNS